MVSNRVIPRRRQLGMDFLALDTINLQLLLLNCLKDPTLRLAEWPLLCRTLIDTVNPVRFLLSFTDS